MTGFVYVPDVFDQMPLGAVVESAMNIELASGGKWLRLDGRDTPRSAVDPVVSRCFPTGVFTSTGRTAALGMMSASYRGTVDASPTYFVACSSSGALMQYSSDGITWSTTSVSMPGGWATPSCVKWCGSRWFAASGDGISNAIACTSGDNPNSSWTGLTLGASPVIYGPSPIAYSPSLAMTTVACGPSQGYVYTIPDGSTTPTQRSVGATVTSSVCWTGTRFIVPGSGALYYSTNGTSYTFLPAQYVFDISSVCSDGAGTVVARANSELWVSKDHGDTWAWVTPPLAALGTQLTNISWVYDRFVILSDSNTSPWLMSKDGLNWQMVVFHRAGGSLVSMQPQGAAYKGGVWLGVFDGSTTCWTATEDASRFKMPMTKRNSTYSVGPCWPQYMKVRN